MRRVITAAITLAVIGLIVLAMSGRVEAGSTHVVQPGETLYRIALRYGVTVGALAAYNGLSDPALIHSGQILNIPPTGARDRAKPAPKPPKPAKTPSAQQATQGNVVIRKVTYRYVVSRGDTLFSIARRFGITLAVLKQANGLTSDLIHPGQRLVIPGAKVSIRIPPPGPTIQMKVPQADGVPAQPAPAESPPTIVNAGDTVTVQRPLRVRRGPGSYFTTLALVAPQTQLLVTAISEGWYEVQLPGGDSGWVRQEELREAPVSRPRDKSNPATGDMVVREAMQYLGVRYVWGGGSNQGLDCSGFIYVVFSAFAPDLLRMASYDYFRMGIPVTQSDLQPGDLVFFTTYAPGASHVGIYVGDHRFLHASSSASAVAISSLDEGYYTARYVGARRLVEPAPGATP